MSSSASTATAVQRHALGRRGRTLGILAFAALILAIGYFSLRGVGRAPAESWDLSVGYSAAHAWLAGHDPYDPAALDQDLLHAGGAGLANGDLLDELRNVYFPATLPVFVPLTLLAWPEARLLGIALNVAATLFIALGSCRLLGWRVTSAKALALVALLLALAPVHTTTALGQTGLVATAAIVAAMLFEASGRRTASGVMFGVATVIKIQIGLPFIAYLFWRRRWAPALAASGLVLGLTALSVGRMQVAGVPWLRGWLDNLAWLSRPGGINDPSTLNPDRFSLINLQFPLHAFIADGTVVQALTLGIVGIAAVVFVWWRRGRDAHPDLLSLSVVAVLGLLVGYHRYYDAVLLVIPIAWACSTSGTARWRLGAVVLVLCADFILPFQTILNEIQQRSILPSALTDNAFWTVVLLPQHVWALVLMAITLFVAAAMDRRPEARTDLERMGADLPASPTA